VRHVDHHRRSNAFRHACDPLEVDHARIGARAHHDHAGLVLDGQLLQLVVVDPLVVLPNAVRNDGVELA
jgi:hypothetical protein